MTKYFLKKTNYKILSLVLIVPLILSFENIIQNKLIGLGAPPGFTIIDFDPKQIISERSNLIVNIFGKKYLKN